MGIENIYYFNNKEDVKILLKNLIINDSKDLNFLTSSKNLKEKYHIIFKNLLQKIEECSYNLKILEKSILKYDSINFKIYYKEYETLLHKFINEFNTILSKKSDLINYKLNNSEDVKLEKELKIFQFNSISKEVELFTELSSINIIFIPKKCISYIILNLDKNSIKIDISDNLSINKKIKKKNFLNNFENVQFNLSKLKKYLNLEVFRLNKKLESYDFNPVNKFSGVENT
jgi:menaquinone-dependent protoporphyrinogen IX oxidase